MKQLVSILIVTIPLACSASDCKWKELRPMGSTLQAEKITIDLGEADDLKAPRAWQGPITSGACTIGHGIIERPLMLVENRYLFVPSYSGSVRRLDVYDLAQCKSYWSSAPFSGSLAFARSGFTIEGRPLPLDERCLPISEPSGNEKTHP